MKWFMVAALSAFLLAGCADSLQYQASGAFTTERTQDDLAAFDAKVKELGGEAAIMESWPEQFRVTFRSADACDAFHNWAHLQSFIDQSVDNHCTIV